MFQEIRKTEVSGKNRRRGPSVRVAGMTVVHKSKITKTPSCSMSVDFFLIQ